MRTVLSIALVAALGGVAQAENHDAFYGKWGDAAQCARAPLIDGGTVTAAPFEISAEWLKHGRIWCSLSWFPVEDRGETLFTGARAQCGEDAVRDYLLGFELAGDELTLRWGFPLFGPLTQCPDA